MKCSKCKGTGIYTSLIRRIKSKCEHCNGSGESIADAAKISYRQAEPVRCHDESGDPLAAMMITSAMGGNGAEAAFFTMATGSTPLGVAIGMMDSRSHDQQQSVTDSDNSNSWSGGSESTSSDSSSSDSSSGSDFSPSDFGSSDSTF